MSGISSAPPDLPSARVGLGGLGLVPPLTGIGRYTWHLAAELRTLLAQPPLLVDGAGWREDLREMPAPVAAAARRSIAARIPAAYKAARWLQQRRFDAGARAIDLYHEPNYLAFRFAGPMVVTVHDLSWIRYPLAHPAVRVRMMNDLMPEVIARASHIVADSEFTRGEVIGHYGARPARVSAVPLGVADHFRPVPHERCAAILAKRGLEPGRYLLALGTIEPRKNLATTIAAYAGMPPALRARFPLVVSGMEGWGGALLSPAMREPIARGEVRLTGYVPQDELPALYSGARAFVYPSLYEGFGLPPLEAMACGAPVIVSSSSSLPEVVGDAGLLVEALDAAALGHAMQSLVDDGALRERLAAQGIARAARFTWRACAERTMQAYRSALDASP